MEKKKKFDERDLVLSLLMEIYREKEFSHILIRNVLDKYSYLESHKKAFIKRLTEGTLERSLQLDYVINQFSKTPVNKMKPLIRTLLRMSVYQLLYMDHVPERAVCNEAVRLAELHKFTSLKGFVNGVLRNIARQKDQIIYPTEDNIKVFISTMYSLPEWLTEHLLSSYGKEITLKVADSFLNENNVTIRIREDLTEKRKEELRKQWHTEGVEVEEHPYLSYAFRLKKTEGITNLAGFAEGEITVQDVSSMLVSEVAGIKPDMTIVDVCGAPGGKATHAALKLQGTGQVFVRDISPDKVFLIEESMRRQKLKNMDVKVRDARNLDETLVEKADIVFCDVPCSGLGVIGKKPDIKYRMNKCSMEDLVILQREILTASMNYLKPGGIMMYSSCTINKEENEQQVKWMIENFDMELISMKEELPVILKTSESDYGLQLFPGVHETDGFFLAKLRKKDKV